MVDRHEVARHRHLGQTDAADARDFAVDARVAVTEVKEYVRPDSICPIASSTIRVRRPIGRGHGEGMAERKPAMKDRKKSAKSSTAVDKTSEGFTAEERAAMKERVQELKADARRGPRADKADGESAVLAKIAEMPERDRAIGERLHAIIKASAPALSPRLWYGMPAYAKDGNVVCFFQSAQKFKTRYATFGFSDKATLDEDAMWPTAFALTELTPADEAKIGVLVKKAVS